MQELALGTLGPVDPYRPGAVLPGDLARAVTLPWEWPAALRPARPVSSTEHAVFSHGIRTGTQEAGTNGAHVADEGTGALRGHVACLVLGKKQQANGLEVPGGLPWGSVEHCGEQRHEERCQLLTCLQLSAQRLLPF